MQRRDNLYHVNIALVWTIDCRSLFCRDVGFLVVLGSLVVVAYPLRLEPDLWTVHGFAFDCGFTLGVAGLKKDFSIRIRFS